MGSYQQLYFILFNAITDAIEAQKQCNYGQALEMLVEAQRNVEEEFIGRD